MWFSASFSITPFLFLCPCLRLIPRSRCHWGFKNLSLQYFVKVDTKAPLNPRPLCRHRWLSSPVSLILGDVDLAHWDGSTVCLHMCGTGGGTNLTVMFFWLATLISLARLALCQGHLLQLVKLAGTLTLTVILNAPGAPLPYHWAQGKPQHHYAV